MMWRVVASAMHDLRLQCQSVGQLVVRRRALTGQQDMPNHTDRWRDSWDPPQL